MNTKMKTNFKMYNRLRNFETEMERIALAANALAEDIRTALHELNSCRILTEDSDAFDTDEVTPSPSVTSLDGDSVTHFAPFGPESDDAPGFYTSSYAEEINRQDDELVASAKDEPAHKLGAEDSRLPEEKSKPDQTPVSASEFISVGQANIEITAHWVCVTKNGGGNLPTPLAEILATKSFKFSRRFRSAWVSRLKPNGRQGKALRDALRVLKTLTPSS